MKIALAQINPTIGDIDGNVRLITEYTKRAKKAGADLVVFPELSIIGYPPLDLLEYRSFIDANLKALDKVAAASKGIDIIAGFADVVSEGDHSSLYNAAALCVDGKVSKKVHKSLLPTYDVFDERRYFQENRNTQVIESHGVRFALTICEDIWNTGLVDKKFTINYVMDPVKLAVNEKPEFIINIAASPYTIDKPRYRLQILQAIAKKYSLPVLYVNQVGGNDQLVFDGMSKVIDKSGNCVLRAKEFEEDLLLVDLNDMPTEPQNNFLPVEEEVIGALVRGTKDYLGKCGFKKAVIGLSGGIDSSLAAVIAAKAIGPENVTGLLMPSPYSSEGSITDAKELAESLGIHYEIIDISDTFSSVKEMLAPAFKGKKEDVTEENIQARIRGICLMAYSNKFGAIVLTTGNKSEVSVGYCTLYGDMVGGLAVISDVPKTMVYQLSRYIHDKEGIISESVLTKAPSAELRPNQTDQDSLPPYDQLDAVLRAHVEEFQGRNEINIEGIDRKTVDRIIHLIQGSEYKRQQMAPGLKISSKAFGFGRRMPIAQRWY